MSVPDCPHCGSAVVRKSSRRASGLFHTTYRCNSCKRHFRRQTYLWYALIGSGILVPVLIGLGLVVLFGQNDAIDEITTKEALPPKVAEAQLDLARKGDPEMQFKTGLEFWSRADYQKAFPWIKAAADHGHAVAKYYLGMAYLYGRGAIQNYHFAQEHFEQAAKLDNQDAQYILGIMYRDGMGMQSSREHAYAWLNIAAARGHVVATHERDKLAIVMSAAAMDHAQEISISKLGEISPGSAHAAGSPQAAPTP